MSACAVWIAFPPGLGTCPRLPRIGGTAWIRGICLALRCWCRGRPAPGAAAVTAARLGGFAYLVPQEDGRILLDNLHVRPGLTGTGLGRRLLRRAFAWAASEHPGRPVYLEVLRDNARATAFYSRQGGRPTGERTERFPAGFELAEIEYSWTAADVADLADGCGP